ncbi:MAG: DUF502 domain-containing protein [Deltaproteobacteria bacterium]|nr:DUF502 domain-containing protein [Deltaproteobacteria bacterium]
MLARTLFATGVHRIAAFVQTTILGGVLVVMPLVLTALLLAKAVAAVVAMLRPIATHLPAGLPLPEIVALVIVIGACFCAGAIVRTGPGRRLKEELDRRLLERIPGYTLIRGLAGRITGQEQGSTFAACLVEIEDALAPAFIVEEHADGRYTVFVPSIPTPAAGTVYILDAHRVHVVDVPFAKAVSVISRWGAGSRDLLAAMRRTKA